MKIERGDIVQRESNGCSALVVSDPFEAVRIECLDGNEPEVVPVDELEVEDRGETLHGVLHEIAGHVDWTARRTVDTARRLADMIERRRKGLAGTASRPIARSDVRVGDYVWAWNSLDGSYELARVVSVDSSRMYPYTVRLGSGREVEVSEVYTFLPDQ